MGQFKNPPRPTWWRLRDGKVHHEAATETPPFGLTYWTALCGVEMAGNRVVANTTEDRCEACVVALARRGALL